MKPDIKKIRIMLNYSQQDFADLLRVDNAHLCRLEKGKVKLSKRLKEILVLKFNVNRDYLEGKSDVIFLKESNKDLLEERSLAKEAKEKLNNESFVYYNTFSQELKELSNIINSSRSEEEEDLSNILKQLDNTSFNIAKNIIIKLFLKQKRNENK